jgi:sigma-B regulation protein RsbQ
MRLNRPTWGRRRFLGQGLRLDPTVTVPTHEIPFANSDMRRYLVKLVERFGSEDSLSVLQRNNVRLAGAGERAMVFAHGFGCDQNMWRMVAPAFEADFRTVLYDQVGAGASDLSAYSTNGYASLQAYADDLVEICRTLELKDAVFVGHSVSAMIGVLAARSDPSLFSALVLVSPSPRYIDDAAYRGGFSAADIDELLESLADNHLGWSAMMAPIIMGNPDRPELGEELANSFCRTDPAIAKEFARVTFMSDNRADLPMVTAATLILQCREDAIAPLEVGEYVRDHIPGSEMVLLDATGHCPNLSAPKAVIAAIQAFV